MSFSAKEVGSRVLGLLALGDLLMPCRLALGECEDTRAPLDAGEGLETPTDKLERRLDEGVHPEYSDDVGVEYSEPVDELVVEEKLSSVVVSTL